MKYVTNPYSKTKHAHKLIVGYSCLSDIRTGSAVGWGRNLSMPHVKEINIGCRLVICSKLIVRGIIT